MSAPSKQDWTSHFVTAIQTQNDTLATGIATHLFNTMSPVEVGLLALDLSSLVSEHGLDPDPLGGTHRYHFPRTRALLWKAILNGWQWSGNEERERYNRFIATDLKNWTEEEQKEAIKTLRLALESPSPSGHKEILHFLASSEPTDNGDILRILGTALGREANQKDLKLFAHVGLLTRHLVASELDQILPLLLDAIRKTVDLANFASKLGDSLPDYDVEFTDNEIIFVMRDRYDDPVITLNDRSQSIRRRLHREFLHVRDKLLPKIRELETAHPPGDRRSIKISVEYRVLGTGDLPAFSEKFEL